MNFVIPFALLGQIRQKGLNYKPYEKKDVISLRSNNTMMWHLVLMAFFYAFAGVSHFRNPIFFLKITPPWVPNPSFVNKLVGFAEIAIAVGLLIPETRSFSAWAAIVLLIAVFPANWFHFQKARAKGKMVVPTLIRLPVQILLIAWAYLYV